MLRPRLLRSASNPQFSLFLVALHARKTSRARILQLKRNFPCYNTLHKMGVEERQTVVLVNPSEVIDVIKQVPEGKLITIVEICKTIPRKHSVKGCCSLTSGIFVMTAANAAEEANKEGNNLGIPYWRTLKSDGYLNAKYPGGQENHKMYLEKESHLVVKIGRRYRVFDFEKKLM